MGRSSALGRSWASLRLCLTGLLIFSCVMIGVAPCSAQDVAAAARQQRTQKESEQKKSKHVYTEQDLRRARILTPEDRAQLEARKNQAAPPLAEKSQEADAQSLPPDAPLGDVARRFRRQKESQRLQQSAEFHLPFSDAVLASPKPPVMPLRPPVSTPAAPKFVPYQPPVKRSPFERPKVFMPASPRTWPSRPPGNRVAPREPAAPIAPAGPAGWHVVTVKPGDSLWKLAQQNLGKGPRWRDLLALNPRIVDANHIAAGSQIYLPAAVSSVRTTSRIMVRRGETLTSIAQTQFGHAAYWSCIAHANPAIQDANRIYQGQLLSLPAACGP
ncbi:MAG: hypothetical protein AUF67_00945 [Acidobacteria bacterium 13_1_20CM_58_21]|nr:MAG: hypothetical protein AUF67_00945 [Acidobacteria bacterium 13_1_20CM_58_21]